MNDPVKFPHPLAQTQNVDGNRVFCFTHQGVEINNAFESSCGRFHVSPDQYGLTNGQARILACP